jgi:hypothetical protein
MIMFFSLLLAVPRGIPRYCAFRVDEFIFCLGKES